jgi:hypothetical protein
MEIGTLALLLVGGLFACIVFVVVVAVVVGQSAEKGRAEGWQRLAIETGLEHQESADLHRRFAFDLFTRYQDGRTGNLLTGEVEGQRASLAEFRYSTRRGRHTKTGIRTVCVIELPGVDLPPFTLRAGATPDGGLLGAIASLALPGDPIRIDDDPAFSSAFLLTGRSPARVRELLTPERRRFLIDGKAALAPLEIEVGGHAILVASPQRLPPDGARQLLDTARSLADRLSH